MIRATQSAPGPTRHTRIGAIGSKRVVERVAIAHVSTFPPLRCGIASFTSDLASAIGTRHQSYYELHYGSPSFQGASANALCTDTDAVRHLAIAINQSDADVVSLQHEFGIWGGSNGENIIPFLDTIDRPIIVTLHTTFDPSTRPRIQGDILQQLLLRCYKVVVLTDASALTLNRHFIAPPDKIVVIPHGVPNVRWQAPPNTNYSKAHPLRLATIGYFRPDKGFENVLQALRSVVDSGIPIYYTIAGSPQAQFGGQNLYCDRVDALVRNLGLTGSVELVRRYLTLAEQLRVIRASHAGVFAYQDPAHASSGTIPLVLACGRPVVCTPFEYAKAKRHELGDAVIVASDFGTPALSEGITQLVGFRHRVRALSRTVFTRTRSWTWDKIGAQYLRLLRDFQTTSARIQ